jgi:hypothetical protein
MNESIVVLTEEPLAEADVQNLASFSGGADVNFFLLVPGNTDRRLLVDFLDNLSLLKVSQAFRELLHRDEGGGDRTSAEETLRSSLEALRQGGLSAEGEVVGSNPVEGLVAKVRQTEARQAVVITRPHAVEDTFHTDWASKAQDELGDS